MKKTTDLTGASKGYKVFSVAVLVVLVLFFLFPLYWIVTGSFKNKIEITAREPVWFPMEPTLDNYARLFDNPAFLWLFNIIFISFAAAKISRLSIFGMQMINSKLRSFSSASASSSVVTWVKRGG